MPRKNKSTDKPAPQENDSNYEDSLFRRRLELEDMLATAHARSSGELGNMGFWGCVGAFAIAADLAFLGGFGTVCAVWSGMDSLDARGKVRAAERELKDVNEKLLKYQEIKLAARAAEPSSKLNPSSPQNGFNNAAEPEDNVETLKKKMAALQQQVEDLQNPKTIELDKPKPRHKNPGIG